ncbi:MAG: RNA polymerase sigma factor [Spirochaetales bacterium]|nr:RNA polymerase sigma factor [Spirochaetales bacterium]
MDSNTHDDARKRLEKAYKSEKPRLLARLRAAGRTLEEAEDLLHDTYAETMLKLPLFGSIRSLPAWLNSLIRRRMIDAWRHDKMRKSLGETEVSEETLREAMTAAGFDPLDSYVRENLMVALNAAIRALPAAQRQVIEAQVFGGKTFREISETTGISIDTLTARKRYALRNLSQALKHWIDE